MKSGYIVLLTSLLAITLSCTAFAQSPTVIPFQGVVEHNGEIIPPSTALTFWIYDLEGGETSLWGPETHIATPVDGVVSLFLGASNVVAVPVTPAVFADGGDRWLAVKIGDDANLLWLRLGSVAYAFNADRLEGNEAGDFAGATHSHNLGELTNVDVGGVGDGDRLVYRGGGWVAEEAPAWGYISINLFGCRLGGEAQFCGHLMEHGAIELLDYTSDQGKFDFCFTLPEDYDNSGDVVYVDVYWYSEATSGDVQLRGNWGSLGRPGEEGRGFNVQNHTTVSLGALASEIHKSSHWVTAGSYGLEPGDAICMGYYRSMWDTCAESVFISGVRIRYKKVQ
ncbi:MAG: hypothetical protein GY835_13795 [bacterium]|nr:hypothetical protein [bacterium]